MKKIWGQIIAGLAVGLIFFSGTPLVLAESVGLDQMIKSEAWYGQLDQDFTAWAVNMGQSYVRYYPGDQMDDFNHAGYSIRDMFQDMAVGDQHVVPVLAHEAGPDDQYVVHAIYSTYDKENPPMRVITYLMVTGPNGYQTLVTEQMEGNFLVFNPTRNQDLAALSQAVDENFGQESGGRSLEENSESNSDQLTLDDHGQPKPLLSQDGHDIFKEFAQFLVDYGGQAQDYQQVLGGNADPNEQNRTVTIDDQVYQWGPAEGADYNDAVVLHNVSTDEWQFLLKEPNQFRFKLVQLLEDNFYQTVDDPPLIEGYIRIHYGLPALAYYYDVNQITPAVSNLDAIEKDLSFLYLNRDQTFTIADFEKYLRTTNSSILPKDSLVVGKSYDFQDDQGIRNYSSVEENGKGNFVYHLDQGGPVFTWNAFAYKGNIVSVSWHQGPEGKVALLDGETYKELSSFTITVDDIQAYWDATRNDN